MQKSIIISFIAALCLTTAGLLPAAETTAKGQPKWEYKIVPGAPFQESALNALGEDGWELITYVSANNTEYTVYKRPK